MAKTNISREWTSTAGGNMRAKLMVVLSSGGAKFAPLFFGLFLMQWFGGGMYASYVVLMNYTAALTAIATLGSAPQILRAGMTPNVNATVFRAALFGAAGMFLLLCFSNLYWAFISQKPFFLLIETTVGWEVKLVSLYCLGLLFVSLSHSMLSQMERWGVLSLSYLAVYWVPLLTGVCFGWYFNSELVSLEAYCIGFFSASLLSLVWVVRNRKLKVVEGLRALDLRGVFADLLVGLRVSLFGLLLLIGFYFSSYYISLTADNVEAAVYSLSFQLFSISIFIPSVLGSIVIPVLSNKKAAGQKVSQIKIILLYVGVSFAVAMLVLAFSPLVLELYNLSAEVSNLVVVMLMQLAALLSSISAYFIQRLVVAGRFGLLAGGAALWLCMLVGVTIIFSPDVIGVVLSFIGAYVAINVFYFCSLCFLRAH